MPVGVVAQGDNPTDATSDPPGDVTVVGFLTYATGRAPDDATALNLYHLAPGTEDVTTVLDWAGPGRLTSCSSEHSVFVVSYPWRWEEVKPDADPTALRAMVEAAACAVRFARGSEYGSETAPLVLTGFSAHGAVAAHVALDRGGLRPRVGRVRGVRWRSTSAVRLHGQ